ncbi:sulfotransferase family protein [Cytobacillus sp. Hm23]
MSFNDIISIHGVPRSGTTWLGQVLDSSPQVRYKYQPLFSYAFKDRLNLQSKNEEILNFYRELYYKSDDFLDQVKQKEIGIHPKFTVKNKHPKYLVTKMVRYHYLIPHLISNVSNIKFLLIVRNPCGVLNSWKKAPREFNREWDFKDQWEFAQNKNMFRPEEYFGFNKWKEATKLFLEMERLYKERVMLIKYEELVENPMKVTKHIYKFFNIDLSIQTEDFIDSSTKIFLDDIYSVYKGQKDVNDWKGELDQNIVRKIYESLENTEFERFLYVEN